MYNKFIRLCLILSVAVPLIGCTGSQNLRIYRVESCYDTIKDFSVPDLSIYYTLNNCKHKIENVYVDNQSHRPCVVPPPAADTLTADAFTIYVENDLKYPCILVDRDTLHCTHHYIGTCSYLVHIASDDIQNLYQAKYTLKYSNIGDFIQHISKKGKLLYMKNGWLHAQKINKTTEFVDYEEE